MASKSLLGWNCSACTFHHKVPAPRCAMCGELRGASRQQMRDFIQGKPIPKQFDGNVVELLTPEEDTRPKKQQNESAKAANEAKKETNPFFAPRSTVAKASNVPARNPYASSISKSTWPDQQLQKQRILPKSTSATIEVPTKVHQALHLQNSRPQTSPQPTTRQPFQERGNLTDSSSGTNNKARPRTKQNQLPWLPKTPYVAGPVPLDPETAKTWIYPQNDHFPTRIYQKDITETALFHNTLVSLPTGLGKTLIAAVVLYNYYRWFPKGKLIFLAPTLPLVSQQAEACYNIMGIPEKDTAILTGKIKASSRIGLWNARRVFYCTPQTVQKDLLSEESTTFASQVVCIVLDEAHKASGDYAYTKVVEQLVTAGAKFRIVGLSATPGTSIKAIQSVINALRINRIEARYEADSEVAPYLHQKQSEFVLVPKNESIRDVEKQLSQMLVGPLERLRAENALKFGTGNATLTAYQIHKAREEYKKRDHQNGAIFGYFSAAYKLVELRNDARASLGIVKTKMQRLKQTPQRGVLSTIVKSADFQNLYQKLLDEGTQDSNMGKSSPKLKKLAELLQEHFHRARATEKSSRAIVFSQWRDSVSEIVKLLESFKPLIRARHFVGQQGSKASNADGEENRLGGMKQAEQHQVIKWFREDVYNVLVCTSIGEEGLDIGEVDLIVNYDTLRSPIRMIQRTGRTGRKRDGRVVCLISEGQEEKTYLASKQAEKTLMRAMRSPNGFSMAPYEKMFPEIPEMVYSTIQIASKFRMSQVGARSSRTLKKSQNWRLSSVQEEERNQRFGKIMVLNEDWRDFRQYLSKARTQNSALRISGGRTVKILKALERFGPMDTISNSRRRGGESLKRLFPSSRPSKGEDDFFIKSSSKSVSSIDTSNNTVDQNPTDVHALHTLPANQPETSTKDHTAWDMPKRNVQPVSIGVNHEEFNGQRTGVREITNPYSKQARNVNEQDHGSGPVESDTILRLPTPPSSSDEEESDDEDVRKGTSTVAGDSAATEHIVDVQKDAIGGDSCFRLPTQEDSDDESDSRGLSTNEHTAASNEMQIQRKETKSENGDDCFRLPTQDSSSSSEDDDDDDNEGQDEDYQVEAEVPAHDSSFQNPVGSIGYNEDDAPLISLKKKRTKSPSTSQGIMDIDYDAPLSSLKRKKPKNEKVKKQNGLKKQKREFLDTDSQLSDIIADTPVYKYPSSQQANRPVFSLSDTPEFIVKARPQQDGNPKRTEELTDTPNNELMDTPVVASNPNPRSLVCEDIDPASIRCFVCSSKHSSEEDSIFLCDGGCNRGFHKSCYSIDVDVSSNKAWLCNECESLNLPKRMKRITKHHDSTKFRKKEVSIGDPSSHIPACEKSNQQETLQRKKEKLERLKRRRAVTSKFMVDEAEIDSDQDSEGDEAEEKLVRQMEEGMSQDSFINDAIDLTQHFSQDELGMIDPEASGEFDFHHRAVDALRDRENQFNTPLLNRQMRRRNDSTLSSLRMSQRGLGQCNFIRSVIDHHRQGGNAAEIEAYYRQVAQEDVAESPSVDASSTMTEEQTALDRQWDQQQQHRRY